LPVAIGIPNQDKSRKENRRQIDANKALTGVAALGFISGDLH
jgi:hypothetical protein